MRIKGAFAVRWAAQNGTDGVDGKDGADAIRIDLNNEMDAVQTDSTGNVIKATTITTMARIYKGAAAVSSGVTAAPALLCGVRCLPKMSYGVVTYSWTIPAGVCITNGKAAVSISVGYGGKTYSAVFTLVASKGTAVYQLQPSKNALSFSRQTDGSMLPATHILSCGYKINDSGTLSQYDGSDWQNTCTDSVTKEGENVTGTAPYNIFYRFLYSDGTPSAHWLWAKDSPILTISSDSSYSAVEYIASSSLSYLTADTDVVDRETIPIVKDGRNGTGVSIVNTEVKYAVTTDTTRPTSGWDTSFPTDIANGNYLWTWTHVEYSDGTSTDAYSVSRHGIDGKGIRSSVVTYSLQENNVNPESISNWGSFPSTLTDGYWLYTRTVITYSEGDTTTSYSVSQVGTGSYYAGCEEYYKAGVSDTDVPSGAAPAGTYTEGQIIDTSWTQSRPTLNTSTPYLWNFEISSDSRGNRYVTDPRCIGNFAKGITSIVETYAISEYSIIPNGYEYPPDISESDWDDEHHTAAPSEEKRYQWNRTVTTYNDSSTQTTYHVSAVKGIDGKGSVYIDLDNENDCMLYNGSGQLISGLSVSNISLYDNGSDVTASYLDSGGSFSIEKSSSVSASISGTVLTVSGITSTDGYVIVRCIYHGVIYSARYTVKRIVGIDKYDLECTPSAITYNVTTGVASSTSIKINVYKTEQNGERVPLDTLPSGFTLKYFRDASTSGTDVSEQYYERSCLLYAGVATCQRVRIELRDLSGNMLDYETIPISRVENGDRGASIVSANVFYAASSSSSNPPEDAAFSTDELSDLLTSTNASRSPHVWQATEITYDDESSSLTAKMYVGKITDILEGTEVYGQTSSPSSSSGITWYVASAWAEQPKIAGNYIWTATRIKYVNMSSYTYIGASCVGYIGSNGSNGSSATNYWLTTSVEEVQRYQTGALSVNNILCSKNKKTGTNAATGADEISLSYDYVEFGTKHENNSFTGIVRLGIWWSEITFIGKIDGVEVVRKTVYIKDTPTSVGSNIINGTNFEDARDSGTEYNQGVVIYDCVDGMRGIESEGFRYSSSSPSYHDFFRSIIHKSGDLRLRPSTWYTLSFWAKGNESYEIALGDDGNGVTAAAYGFAHERVNFTKGSHRIEIEGCISSAALAAGKELRVFVYKEDWSWQSSAVTTSTSREWFEMEFEIPTTGEYKISAYVYNSSDSTIANDTLTATVYSYVIYSSFLRTHVYPSAIDTNSIQVSDGVSNPKGKPSDGNCDYELSPSWTFHTFTFKTKSVIPILSGQTAIEQRTLFRHLCGTGDVSVCKIKLERGIFATEWCRSEYDKTGGSGIDGCIMRVTEWSAGVEYRNDTDVTLPPRFLDIVVVDADSSSTSRYMCRKTHVSTSEHTPEAEGGDTGCPSSTNSNWQKLDDTFPIYTPLIMADHALLRFTQTNQLLVQDDDAGKSIIGRIGGGDYLLSLGGSVPSQAPFSVTKSGKMRSTDAYISGTVKADILYTKVKFVNYTNDSDSWAIPESSILDNGVLPRVLVVTHAFESDKMATSIANARTVLINLPDASTFAGAEIDVYAQRKSYIADDYHMYFHNIFQLHSDIVNAYGFLYNWIGEQIYSGETYKVWKDVTAMNGTNFWHVRLVSANWRNIYRWFLLESDDDLSASSSGTATYPGFVTQ